VAVGTRERIVTAGAELFRRNGYTGTGVKQIVAAAGAPFGSLYHFFPGGKEHLGREVIHTSGALYGQLIAEAFDQTPDAVSAVRAFFAGAAQTLRDTDYADACPIATVALEVASTNEPLRLATAEVFESWIVQAAERFAAAGIAADTARRLTVFILCSLEGAYVLCRASRSTDPLDIAGAAAADAVAAALPKRRRR
jgi:AcrR family transcriptional regulator